MKFSQYKQLQDLKLGDQLWNKLFRMYEPVSLPIGLFPYKMDWDVKIISNIRGEIAST